MGEPTQKEVLSVTCSQHDIADKTPAQPLKKLQPPTPLRQPICSHPTKKWLKKSGEKMSDAELRVTSCSWKPKDWEDYLSSLENTHARELPLTSQGVLNHLTTEDYTEALVDIFSCAKYPHLEKYIDQILKTLTDHQRRVVFLKYWENKSLKEIAEIMGVRYQSVQKTLGYSHKKIEKQLKTIAAKEELQAYFKEK